MVCAILEGRKTQTRRIVKPSRAVGGRALEWLEDGFEPGYVASPENHLCPYGQPGDLLWVRETWSGHYTFRDVPPGERETIDFGSGSLFFKEEIWYWADGNPTTGDWEKPRPSIHMPRWASRITLEIVSVRVERLQDISADDAVAEGLYRGKARRHLFWQNVTECRLLEGETHQRVFGDLWSSINGADSWNANPWVWVIEFKRVDAHEQAA